MATSFIYTATGSSSPAGAESYITVDQADGYAAQELDSSVWDALSEAEKAAAIAEATRDIDAARYQGQRYDAGQARQFPRIKAVLPDGAYTASDVWDWDDDADEAAVPENVKRACGVQAASIASGARDARRDDRHDGVAAQSAGGMSESYDGRPMRVLCRRADVLMRKYYLRSGSLI